MALSYSWNTITSAQTDADSPLDTTLMEGIRQNLIHLQESLYSTYTASTAHDHDGTNSAFVASVGEAAVGYKQVKKATVPILTKTTETELSSTSTAWVDILASRVYISESGTYTLTGRVELKTEGAGPAPVQVRLSMNSSYSASTGSSSGSYLAYTPELTVTGLTPGWYGPTLQVISCAAATSAVIRGVSIFLGGGS